MRVSGLPQMVWAGVTPVKQDSSGQNCPNKMHFPLYTRSTLSMPSIFKTYLLICVNIYQDGSHPLSTTTFYCGSPIWGGGDSDPAFSFLDVKAIPFYTSRKELQLTEAHTRANLSLLLIVLLGLFDSLFPAKLPSAPSCLNLNFWFLRSPICFVGISVYINPAQPGIYAIVSFTPMSPCQLRRPRLLTNSAF